MKYPRIPRDQRKNVKIPSKEYNQIRNLKEEGLSYQKIADYYNVNIATIWNICNPKKYKANVKKQNETKRAKIQKDPIYKRKVYKKQVENCKKRRREDPKFRKYLILRSREYNKQYIATT